MDTSQNIPFLTELDQSDIKAFIEMAPFLRELSTPYKLSKEERFAFGKIIAQVTNQSNKKPFLDSLQYLNQLQDFHPTFLSDTLSIILETNTEHEYQDVFLELLPEQIGYTPLLFNLCRLHARQQEKGLLLKYMRMALDLGMHPKEFKKATDFKFFQSDVDFSQMLDGVSPSYIQPVYVDFLWEDDMPVCSHTKRSTKSKALRLDYHETQGRFPNRVANMQHLEHLSLVNYSPGLPIPIAILKTLEKLTSLSWVPLEWGTPFPNQLLELQLVALEVPEYVLESIVQLPHVKRLYLHGKILGQTLRTRYGTLYGVKHLTLSAIWEHKLQIPKEIGELQQLESLCIEGPIDTLPESFSNLVSLKHLRILTHKNDITFPEIITQLKNLEELEIIGSPFIEIPDSLGQLQKLRKLSLAHSFNEYLYQKSISRGKIDVPPVALPNCFEELKNLRELDLSFCAVHDVRPLSKLKKLQVLYAVGTPVTDVTFLKNVQVFDRPDQLILDS